MHSVTQWLATTHARNLWAASVALRIVLALIAIAAGAFIDPDDRSAQLMDVDPMMSNAAERHGTRPFPVMAPLWYWDAVHFRHIADYGYTHENLFAFYPMIPLLIRLCLRVAPAAPFALFSVIQWSISGLDVVLMRAVLCEILQNRPGALSSSRPDALLFAAGARHRCTFGMAIFIAFASPAAIFSAVSYTEPLFALCTLVGLWLLLRNQLMFATGSFFLASVTRSNGLLASGLIVCDAARVVSLEQQTRLIGNSLTSRGSKLIPFLVYRLLAAFTVVLPYIAMNMFTFVSLCQPALPYTAWSDFPTLLDRPDRGDALSMHPAVCADGRWWHSYDVIQRHYWQVDWFSYYVASNVHHFAIAAPLYGGVTVALIAAWRAMRASSAASGGLPETVRKMLLESPISVWTLAMLFIGAVRMHVQVANRFLSVSPGIYVLLGATACESRVFWVFILAHIAMYSLLGPVLFGTYYPWT